MEHVIIAFQTVLLFALVLFLLSGRVIVLRTSTRIKVLRPKTTQCVAMPVQPGEGTAGDISGEVRPAVRSIRQCGDVSRALEAAGRTAEKDLVSALLNLGCDKGKAGKVAKQAMKEASDFDGRMIWAMRNAA
jgi:hypothetical protein